MTIELTRAQRSRMTCALNDALNINDTDTDTELAAFVAAICWSGDLGDIGETFSLAAAIEDAVDQDLAHCIVSAAQFEGLFAYRTVTCKALRLAGLKETKVNGKCVWATTSKATAALPTIELKSNILQEWSDPV